MPYQITLPDVLVTLDNKPPENAQVAGILSPGGALTHPPEVPAHDVQLASRLSGYSWDDIDRYERDFNLAASENGYSQGEIDEHRGWPDPAPFHERQDALWQSRVAADPSITDALNSGASADRLLTPDVRADYARALIDGHVKNPMEFADTFTKGLAAQTANDSGDVAQSTKDRADEIAPEMASKLPTHEQALDYAVGLTHDAGVPLTPESVANTKANLLRAWAASGAPLGDIHNAAANDPDLHRQLVAAPPQPSKHEPWEIDPVLAHFYQPQALTPDEAQKQFQKRIRGKNADQIEPFSMMGEPVNHGQSFGKFLEEAGVSTVEIAAGGYVLGKAFQFGGRTLGYLWSKALELNPEAAAGKAMRPVPLEKLPSANEALHAQAQAISRGEELPQPFVGELPKKGLVVAARDADGNLYVGKPGETHGDLLVDVDKATGRAEPRAAEKMPPANAEMGFIGADGNFLTREEALARVSREGHPVQEKAFAKESGELDAADYNEAGGVNKAPEATAPPEELAEGYTATSGLTRWVHGLDPEIVKSLQPFMFGGFGNLFRNLFRTPAKQAERQAFRDGRDFAERSLTRLYSLGSQEIAQFVHDLEPLRRLVTPHLKEWESEIAKGPAGMPMDTMIGNLVRYMQGRSTGVTLRPDSPLAPVADMIRAINQALEAKLRAYDAAGKINLTSYYQDYFRQMWDNPNLADQVFPGAARQGSSGSLRQRTYPTWEAGLNAGLKPKITDPIELTIYDIGSKIRYLGAIDTRDEAIASGHAYWATAPAAPGDTQLAGNLAQRLRPYVDQATGEARVIADRLYASAGYARSFNNWHSMGMFSHPVSEGLYDKLMYVSNTLTGLKLLNPIFHIRTVGLGSVASGFGQSMEELSRKQFLRAMGTFAGLPIRPITDYFAGNAAHKAYLDKALSNPTVQRLVEAGLTFGERPQVYKMTQAPNLYASIKRGSLLRELGQDLKQIAGSDESTRLVRALRVPDRTLQFGLKEAGRLMSSFTAPIFDNFIPRMKAGAAMRRLESWLAANPTASEGAVANRTRLIVKDIENREGELNLDTVFWPKMAKQLSTLAMISTGWKYGSYRGFMAAAGIDIERGRWAWNPVALTSTIGTVLGYGTFNTIEQYLHTGVFPWETNTPLMDMAFYRTGTVRDGQPVRGMIPSELKEIVDLGRIIAFSIGDPAAVPQATVDYALGAVNSFWQIVRTMATGEDAIGHKISFTPGGWPAYLREQLLPIFASQEENRKGDSGISWLENFLGDKEAPSWIVNPAKYQGGLAGVRARWTKEENSRAAREQNARDARPIPDRRIRAE